MKEFINFFKLAPSDKRAAFRLSYQLFKAAIIMRILPYSYTRKLVFRKTAAHAQNHPDAVRILRRYLSLLNSICARLPGEFTCLRKAVALRNALYSAGVNSEIKLGIKRGDTSTIAHAWLECCGIEVLNNGIYNEFMPDSDMIPK